VTTPAIETIASTPAIETIGRRKPKIPYVLVVPAVLVIVLGAGYPLVWQIVTSFQEYGLSQQFGQAAPFVGLANYIELATNPELWAVVARSLAFCIITAFLTVGIGILLALLMANVGRVVRLILQVGLLLAWAMPVVAAMTVWIWLFDRRRGAINYMLDMIPGVDMNRFDWLATPWTFFLVAGIIVIWGAVPFVALSVYAALLQVSEEVMEAAQLDGANGWQRFWGIIGPMIQPVIAIVLLLNLIWDLRVFTQITLLKDAGSKSGDFDLLGTYIYKLGTSAQDFGMASAVSILVLGITVALSWFYVRRLLKDER